MADAGGADGAKRTLKILNKRGLHARAAAKFVRCAEGFDADITVTRDGQSVPGTSIMGLLMLSATTGSTILVTAKGPAAKAAIAALDALVAERFGEDGPD